MQLLLMVLFKLINDLENTTNENQDQQNLTSFI